VTAGGTHRPQVGLLDTNTVIYLEELDADDLPIEPVISAITLAELTAGPLATDDPIERARRQRHLQLAELDFDALPFTAECARRFGMVRAALAQSGRKGGARSYDALIAASALAYDLPLYTSNTRDFTDIPGLDLRPVTPPSEQQ
jgi:tRNA(fMet)-specific endonuclease VapC